VGRRFATEIQGYCKDVGQQESPRDSTRSAKDGAEPRVSETLVMLLSCARAKQSQWSSSRANSRDRSHSQANEISTGATSRLGGH
jgi:hypothetical protein